MEGSAFFHNQLKTHLAASPSAEMQRRLAHLLNFEQRSELHFKSCNPDDIPVSNQRAVSYYTETQLNDVRRINKFLEQMNEAMVEGQRLVGSFETYRARRQRILFYRIPVVKQLWIASEFIFLRLFPKTPLLKDVYFGVTKGKGRLLSKAEALGRLVCCGFEIESHESVDGIIWFSAKKVQAPAYDRNASFGALFRMKRIGKGGKTFHVLKFRTMHPYSEYLHDYVLKMNGYATSGKPADDFRLTPWGKFMRRYWLDELPQLINVLKGDMKLVGVRPVSPRYFQDIPAHIQALRTTQKPGCIPPYVSLNRKPSVEEVLAAEEEYLLEKKQRPFFTDTRYFFKALYNIVVKRKRSA